MKKFILILSLICSIASAADSLYVRGVDYLRRPVFPPEEGFGYFPFTLLNRLHIPTKSFVLDRFLTFGTSIHPEKLDFQLEETRRILRAQDFMGDARINLVKIDGDSVDVTIEVEEVWTTKPSASLSVIGDKLEYGVDFTESNFLGLGSEVEIEYEHTVDDDFIHCKLETAPILPFDTELSLYYDMTDRFEEVRASYKRPYITGHKKLLFKSDFFSGKGRRDRYYDSDSILYEYGLEQLYFGTGFFYSPIEDLYTGLGYSHLERNIDLPEKEMRLGEDNLHIGATYQKASYKRECPIDEFSCDPDVPTGYSASLWLQIDERGEPGLSFSASYSTAFELGLMSAGISSNHYDYMQYQSIYFTYATPTFLWSRLALAAQYSGYHNGTDIDYLAIGSKNNLRGYSYREIVDKGLLTANSELRIFPPLEVMSVRSSVVLFSDIGKGINHSDWLVSLGGGLRLTSSKSTSGTIGRIEIAWPMNGETVHPTLIVKTELPFKVLRGVDHDFHPLPRDKAY